MVNALLAMKTSFCVHYLHNLSLIHRYCDPVEASADAGYQTGVISPAICPRGYFCLLNTETKHEHPCPVGSYGNRTELESEDECNLCDGGWYCPTQGLLLRKQLQ